jgi:hypothetical protein
MSPGPWEELLAFVDYFDRADVCIVNDRYKREHQFALGVGAETVKCLLHGNV